MDSREFEKILLGFGAGLLIGGLLGILFTPHSGKELKNRMVDLADDLTDRVNKFREPEKYSRFKP